MRDKAACRLCGHADRNSLGSLRRPVRVGIAPGVGWNHRGILPLTPDRRSLAITIPALLTGLSGLDMNSAYPALVDIDTAAADLCATCKHPLVSHDAISARWCAATKLGIGRRACICSGVVATARVLTHY